MNEEVVEGEDKEVVEWVDWLVDLDLVVGLDWHDSVFGVPYTHCKSDMFYHSQQNQCVVDCDVQLNSTYCSIVLHLMISIDWSTSTHQYSRLDPV
jgi:hypothetical protein